MKKMFLMLGVAVLCLGAASCSKDDDGGGADIVKELVGTRKSDNVEKQSEYYEGETYTYTIVYTFTVNQDGSGEVSEDGGSWHMGFDKLYMKKGYANR